MACRIMTATGRYLTWNGTMTPCDGVTTIQVKALRTVSAGQGLMLETSSRRLMLPGMPHHNCPDKDPDLRLLTIEAAGQAAVPYTSGLLIGIGETREERIQSLLDLRALDNQYGHIQVGHDDLQGSQIWELNRFWEVALHGWCMHGSAYCYLKSDFEKSARLPTTGAHHPEFCAEEEYSHGACDRASI